MDRIRDKKITGLVLANILQHLSPSSYYDIISGDIVLHTCVRISTFTHCRYPDLLPLAPLQHHGHTLGVGGAGGHQSQLPVLVPQSEESSLTWCYLLLCLVRACWRRGSAAAPPWLRRDDRWRRSRPRCSAGTRQHCTSYSIHTLHS